VACRAVFGIGWLFARRDTMAKKTTLKEVGARIGKAIGKADRKAQKFAKAGVVAKEELQAISKQIDELKSQLQKTTKRLKKALS
jgi:succinyl-CoA synthetase alpha subunit